MAETSAVRRGMQMMLFAKVTPLSLAAKTVGSILAVAVIAVSFYLIRRTWAVRHHRAQLPGTILLHTRLRLPTAMLMAVCGAMLFAGLWIDPAAHPAAFIYFWSGTMLVVLALFVLAFCDMFRIRGRAREARRALLEERQQIFEEIRRVRGDRGYSSSMDSGIEDPDPQE